MEIKFLFTKHAKERMEERLGARRDKWDKVMRKVWRIQNLPPHWWVNHQRTKGYHNQFRIFQGHVFVFAEEPHGDTSIITLVTIYPYDPNRLLRYPIYQSQRNV